MRATAAMIALLLIATPALAQDTNAPALSEENPRLYAHGGAAGGDPHWMSTLPNDGGTAPGYTAPGGVVRFTMTHVPGFDAPVHLDASGSINVLAFIGGSNYVGEVSVSTEIRLDGEVIAAGAKLSHTILPRTPAGASQYDALSWTLVPTTTTFEPGQELVWEIIVDGTTSTAVFMGMGESRGRSALKLPIVDTELSEPAGPRVSYQNLTGAEATATVTVDRTTNGTWFYNWTQNQTNLVFSYTATGNGMATIAFVDAQNKTIVQNLINGTESENVTLADVAPGNATIRLVLQDYNGTISFTVRAASAPSETNTGTSTSEPTPAPGNTGNTTSPPAEKSPGLPFMFVLAALATLAWRRRRD